MIELLVTGKYFSKQKGLSTIQDLYSKDIRIDPDGEQRFFSSYIEREKRLDNIRYMEEIALELLATRGMKIVDLGAGYCTVGCFKGIASYVGVDKAMPTLRDCARFENNEQYKFINTSIEEFVKTVGSNEMENANTIIMNHVIEHLEEPYTIVNQIHKRIRKETLVIIGTTDFDSGAERRYVQKYRLLKDPTHISLFSMDSLTRMVRDIGFKIMRIEFPYFQSSYFNLKDLEKLLMDPEKVDCSPPFYGNFITLFLKK